MPQIRDLLVAMWWGRLDHPGRCPGITNAPGICITCRPTLPVSAKALPARDGEGVMIAQWLSAAIGVFSDTVRKTLQLWRPSRARTSSDRVPSCGRESTGPVMPSSNRLWKGSTAWYSSGRFPQSRFDLTRAVALSLKGEAGTIR